MNKLNNKLSSIFNKINSKQQILDPDENFKQRLYATIPQKSTSYYFFRNKAIKIAMGFAAICIIVVIYIPGRKTDIDDRFKPTITIVIEDKTDPDYFKPTKVVTITEADQIQIMEEK